MWTTVKYSIGIGFMIFGILILLPDLFCRENGVLLFWENNKVSIAMELLFAALTILILDSLNEMRQETAELRKLVQDLTTGNKTISTRAARELVSRGKMLSKQFKKQPLEFFEIDNVDFKDSDLRDSIWEYGNITNSDLSRAKLGGVRFVKVDFSGTDFKSVDLANVQFLDCELKSALGANLPKIQR